MRLAIVGASARAAAFSAVAAGHEVVAADLFADADLAECCNATRIADWPNALGDWLSDTRADGWLYTGGLENHPSLLARMAAQMPLWGTPPDALAALRDPLQLAAACAEHGIRFPKTHPSLPTDTHGTRWLVKRTDTSGGMGVSWLDSHSVTTGHIVVQEFIDDAQPCSAVFVVDRWQAHLLGASRQLVGCDWLRAGEFAYCGSVISDQHPCDRKQATLAEIGKLLHQCGAVGVVGVDLLARGDELWLVEINPRYPASAEVVETALPEPVVSLHVKACRGERLSPIVPNTAQPSGKAILFASRDVCLSAEFYDWSFAHRLRAGGWLADLPAVGTLVAAGSPLLTVLARSAGNPERELRRRVADIELRLYAG